MLYIYVKNKEDKESVKTGFFQKSKKINFNIHRFQSAKKTERYL